MIGTKAHIKPSDIPKSIKYIAENLKRHNHQCYIVGGAIRDLIMKKKPQDYDLASSATPEEIKKIFKRVIPTGIKHGTVTILVGNDKYEVTTFREEEGYTDLRHPDKVIYTRSLETDLKRRDFTINAIAYDPIEDKLYDPHDGQKDIKRKIIRTVGNPYKRFEEDALRILRAIRFSSQLSFTIEENTYEAIVKHSHNITKISWERIREEFTKIILSDSPSYGIKLMEETGILANTIPELLETKNITQGDMHVFDVYEHLLACCNAVEKKDIVIRLAALFHDIGKPRTKKETKEKGLTFYRHEIESAKLAKTILTRLKYPNITIQKVCHLIENHMVKYTENWTDGAIRRYISRIGEENIPAHLELLKADKWAVVGKKAPAIDIEALRYRVDKEIKSKSALSLKDLQVDGNSIKEHLKISSGPWIGKILKYLLDAVLDDPKLNTKEKLLEIAEKYYKKYS